MNVTLTVPSPRTNRILRINQVIDTVGLSRSAIHRLGKLGLFPRPFKIGLAAVGWDAAEIEFWI